MRLIVVMMEKMKIEKNKVTKVRVIMVMVDFIYF